MKVICGSVVVRSADCKLDGSFFRVGVVRISIEPCSLTASTTDRHSDLTGVTVTALTLCAHVRCREPHVHQTRVLMQARHGLWGHDLCRVAPASVRVVQHVPLCLEVHHGGDAQFVLHLYGHVLHLARAAAQPHPLQHPGVTNASLTFFMSFLSQIY